MDQRSNTLDPVTASRAIHAFAESGRFAVVLGAGIQSAVGLPSWDQIAVRLFETAFIDEPLHLAPALRLSYFRDHCCSTSTEFHDRLADALYQDVDLTPKALGENAMLRSLTSLLLAIHGSSQIALVSFANDDVIETYLEAHGLRVEVVTAEPHRPSTADVISYHPYGVVPNPYGKRMASDVILESGASHYPIMPRAWHDHLCAQLASRFTLFLGVIPDSGVFKLLDDVRVRHLESSEVMGYWGMAVTPAWDRGWSHAWVAQRIAVRRVDDMSDFLFSITAMEVARANVPTLDVETARSADSRSDQSRQPSIFISYGGPDEHFAAKLNDRLSALGLRTFLFPKHAPPGEKLHRVMRDGINDCDRVVLICSERSLDRPGVLNEIEESLEREAREGGASILIPVAVDDYVFHSWNPSRSGLAQSIRARVVVDFRGALGRPDIFEEGVKRLVSALVAGA